MDVQTNFGFFTVTMREVDPCARKNKGNAASDKAWEKARVSAAEWRDRIHKFIYGCDTHGGTLKEFCKCAGVDLNVVSGRFSECLQGKDGKRIYDSKRPLRNGCRVYVIRKEWVSGSSDREER